MDNQCQVLFMRPYWHTSVNFIIPNHSCKDGVARRGLMSCSGHILCPGSTPEGHMALSTLAGLALHNDMQNTHGTDLPSFNPPTSVLMLDTTAQYQTRQHHPTQGTVCWVPPESQQCAKDSGHRESRTDRAPSPVGSVIGSAGTAASRPSGCRVEGAPGTQEVEQVGEQSGGASPTWLSNAGEVLSTCWGMWSRLVEKARE